MIKLSWEWQLHTFCHITSLWHDTYQTWSQVTLALHLLFYSTLMNQGGKNSRGVWSLHQVGRNRCHFVTLILWRHWSTLALRQKTDGLANLLIMVQNEKSIFDSYLLLTCMQTESLDTWLGVRLFVKVFEFELLWAFFSFPRCSLIKMQFLGLIDQDCLGHKLDC